MKPLPLAVLVVIALAAIAVGPVAAQAPSKRVDLSGTLKSAMHATNRLV